MSLVSGMSAGNIVYMKGKCRCYIPLSVNNSVFMPTSRSEDGDNIVNWRLSTSAPELNCLMVR